MNKILSAELLENHFYPFHHWKEKINLKFSVELLESHFCPFQHWKKNKKNKKTTKQTIFIFMGFIVFNNAAFPSSTAILFCSL